MQESFPDVYSFGYSYGDDLFGITLPIEHDPVFANIGARLELGEESDSTSSSTGNEDDANNGISFCI
jgi:hypothetical protein